MNNRKILIIILTAVLVICLCGLCISISLLASSRIIINAGSTKTTTSTAPSIRSTTPSQSSTRSTPLVSTSTIEAKLTEGELTPLNPSETQILEPSPFYASSSTVGSVALDPWCIPWNTKSERALVREVVDGVTIEVEIAGVVRQVRYVGIGLPDYLQDPGNWNISFEKNRELVEGKTVLLIKDRSEVDAEGRLLRYALLGSVFINRQLVENGYAVAVSTPPDISCDLIFQEAEELARATGRGLWAPTSTPSRTIPTYTSTPPRSGDLIIVKISPTGTIWQEPEEYVEILNDGSQPVQLQDWTLRDSKGHVFTFPGFVLGPQQYCRVYTDLYLPEYCGFTYFSLSPIWENDGDCAYLKDRDGVLVDMYCYD